MNIFFLSEKTLNSSVTVNCCAMHMLQLVNVIGQLVRVFLSFHQIGVPGFELRSSGPRAGSPPVSAVAVLLMSHIETFPII